jgi:hypothetical protein
MREFSHQDEVVIRAFFAENRDAFKEWVESTDEDTDHFAGVAEATTFFVALCAALKNISGAMDSIDKITKHAKHLALFARNLIEGKKEGGDAPHFELSERLLILVFDYALRFGKGVSTEKLVALTGARQEEAEKALKRLEIANIIRLGRWGWVVAR